MFKGFVAFLGIMALVGLTPPVTATNDAATDPSPAEAGASKTPPRLSFVQGEVSFWRPGADDWAVARINTALEAGDTLYTGAGANLEVQVGPMVFLRAAEHTEVGLENLEPDFVQMKMTAGHVALDARRLDDGQTLELDTPNAAISIDRSGYYRIDITADSTAVISRRGGHATVTPAGSASFDVTGNEETIIQGTETPQISTYQAPKLDDWDWWNYNRTDSLLASGRGSYLPADMYGSQQLSQYGTWQYSDPYGQVWVPNDVGPTWAPYSDGDWMWDPYYNWVWVDNAPWGWAPYHYGRWVHWNNCWAWAPGPVIASPVWQPALVGFLGFPGFSVGAGFGTPIGWVALGWGEPLWPWWGGVGFIGSPCWGGWYGPHLFHHTDFDHHRHFDHHHGDFENIHAPHAVVAVAHGRFGNGPVQRARIGNILHSVGARGFQPIHGALPVRAGPQSLVAAAGRGIRPPDRVMDRRVVATRAPRMPVVAHNPAAMRLASAMNPAPLVVPAVQRRMAATAPSNARHFQQPPSTFQSGNARRFVALPNGNTRAQRSTSRSPRFAPPAVPHSELATREGFSQQRGNPRGGFAFASRSGPESESSSGRVGTFSVVHSPRQAEPSSSSRIASVPPVRGTEPRFEQRAEASGQVSQPRVPPARVPPARVVPARVVQPRVAQPRIASPRFSAPAMSAPHFGARQAPAFRAPSGSGGGRVAGGHFRGGRVTRGGSGRR